MTWYDTPDWLGVPTGTAGETGNLYNFVNGGTILQNVSTIGANSVWVEIAQQNGTNTEYQLYFTADAAGLIKIGPSYTLIKATQSNTRFAIPVWAPYMALVVPPGTVCNGQVIVYFAGTQASQILENFPLVIDNTSALAVPANSTITRSPTLQQPGKYKIWAITTENGFVTLKRWNGTAWTVIDNAVAVAGTPVEMTGNQTADDHQLIVSNNSATAGTVSSDWTVNT